MLPLVERLPNATISLGPTPPDPWLVNNRTPYHKIDLGLLLETLCFSFGSGRVRGLGLVTPRVQAGGEQLHRNAEHLVEPRAPYMPF